MRNEAIECLGLFCCLDELVAESYVPLLLKVNSPPLLLLVWLNDFSAPTADAMPTAISRALFAEVCVLDTDPEANRPVSFSSLPASDS